MRYDRQEVASTYRSIISRHRQYERQNVCASTRLTNMHACTPARTFRTHAPARAANPLTGRTCLPSPTLSRFGGTSARFPYTFNRFLFHIETQRKIKIMSLMAD